MRKPHANDTDPGQADDSEDARRAIDDFERGLEEPYPSQSVIQGWTNRRILGVAPIAQALGVQVVGYKARPGAKEFDRASSGCSNDAGFLGRVSFEKENAPQRLFLVELALA